MGAGHAKHEKAFLRLVPPGRQPAVGRFRPAVARGVSAGSARAKSDVAVGRVLLAWGTDLMRVDERWSNAKAKRHAAGARVQDPFQLRLNSYRVLLTRGRDGTVVFVPPVAELDETAAHLQTNGFRMLR